MQLFRSALGVWLLLGVVAHSHAIGRDELCCINSKLKGKVLDFTNNHGSDNRIWSQALCHKARPVRLHTAMLRSRKCRTASAFTCTVPARMKMPLCATSCNISTRPSPSGKLPPFIIAAPDGSLKGRPSLLRSASFWVNSPAGRFEDWVEQDVWDFMNFNFRIRPEREAHALIGASMGGCGAFGHGIKYRDATRSSSASCRR